jgi:hypothetical protein
MRRPCKMQNEELKCMQLQIFPTFLRTSWRRAAVFPRRRARKQLISLWPRGRCGRAHLQCTRTQPRVNIIIYIKYIDGCILQVRENWSCTLTVRIEQSEYARPSHHHKCFGEKRGAPWLKQHFVLICARASRFFSQWAVAKANVSCTPFPRNASSFAHFNRMIGPAPGHFYPRFARSQIRA